MTRTLQQIVAALMCLSIFAGTTRAGVFFFSNTESFDTSQAHSFMYESPGHHSNDDDDDDNDDDQPMNHRLFPDQLLKVNVTLDAVPQLYHLELTVMPHIDFDDDDNNDNNGHGNGHGHGHGHENANDHSSDNLLIEVGVNINGELAGVITFDTVSNEWQTGWLDVGVLSGDISVTFDWLNPPPFDDDAFLKIRPLVFTSVVPTPATVVLMLTSFGFAASRRRRE